MTRAGNGYFETETQWAAGAMASLCAVLVLVVGIAVTPSPAEAQGCDLSEPGACTATSLAALRACRNEVRDDYWIAIGNCRNLTSGRRRCIRDARDERAETRDECVDMCAARQEVCDELGQGPYDPEIDPADFVDPVAAAANPNQYWPLVPGTVWEYEGGDETITVTVTDETKEILGVECVVVRDVAEEDGEVIESTDDWYAQDTDGNVWYFGEISLNFEDGELVDIEGSWTSGVDGAKPGILMPAAPQIGEVYRQEFFLGDAEDMGEVVSLTGNEAAPAAACANNCLVTNDFTPIEPDVEESKHYLPGVGMILEIDEDTGERVELVDLTVP